MSNLTLSELVIETFTKGLGSLTQILQKAEEHAKATGIDADAVYPSARLVDDMLPLTFQVQIATRTVLKVLTRLQGGDATIDWEDDEKTFADLYKRIDKAREVILSADKGVIDGRQLEIVEVPAGPQVLKLTGKDSVLNQGIPNFYFHLQTAFAILRARGVPIGKWDYIGSYLVSYF
ncbi:hypothetical protein B0H66DRAFT_555517 [Apodospora peruviana]|uniref:Helix-turn-helix-domain containing protein type n=1 Tax=Apodospora peruviana TaxID=516989 RepID=A0AAE0ID91_9PEZI|nr:hypothetical protein B0H66DRAFT_555517 [Apodospora peruviana]